MYNIGEKVICITKNSETLVKGKIYTIVFIEPTDMLGISCDKKCEECYMFDLKEFSRKSFCSNFFKSLKEMRKDKLKRILK